eukprot:TRINITY_DN598_c0_g2_i1.p1 TRINITY_DN598_c0_g2~~TRINITY_DN598_c0_g2_i1.p1  ORF type:complete len:536 (+),score=164.71 TRINITY_DN598_c0_g2_i1:101-1708(+)
MRFQLVVVLVLVCFCAPVFGDFPVHCEFSQIRGTWLFQLSDYSYSKDVVDNFCQVTSPFPNDNVPLFKTKRIQIGMDSEDPSIAVDLETNKVGTWTLTYDQSFELVFDYVRYLAFFNFTQNGKNVTSYCNQTFTGWFNRIELSAPRFGCLRAQLISQSKGNKIEIQDEEGTAKRIQEEFVDSVHVYNHHEHYAPLYNTKLQESPFPYENPALVQYINQQQRGWVAGPALHARGKTVGQVQKMSGTPLASFRIAAQRKHMNMMRRFGVKKNQNLNRKDDFPTNFDWRNVNGRNFVTPIRNQGNCGSCYSFATTAMFEARYLVERGLAVDETSSLIFSPQDIVECSRFSQGCDGGFPEQVSKYGEAWGIGLEKYNNYTGNSTSKCHKWDYDQHYGRIFTTNYFYVDDDGEKGYYGSSTERGMIINILKKGPIAVSIMVYSDFQHYKSGVYRHVQSPSLTSIDTASLPPPHFVITNHVVLVVGYGETEDGDKYWIIKNSWGEGWGMGGFGWIARGSDEIGIESMPISADVVLDNLWNF